MSEPVSLGRASVVRESEKALLVVLEDYGEERWIPKSVIHDNSECYSVKGGDGDLLVESWFAHKEGLD